ncbi:MAG TPA: hypothetical protein VGG45_00585, partial [Terracidiphilus sp.]
MLPPFAPAAETWARITVESNICIVTASVDKTARIWNAATGQLIAILHGHESAVFSAAFSPDGKRIITAS